MSTARFGRVLTAMVTPFDDNLEIDFDMAARLAVHLLDHGSDGIVVAGTTGESPALSHDEKLELFRVVLEAVDGRGPVIAGTGTNSTASSVQLTREASELGVDAVMAVCPYYNRPPQSGLLAHYRAVAAATDLPVIVYNVPSRTGRNIEPDTVLELAEVDNIVALKQASPAWNETTRLCADAPSGFDIYSGDDGNTFYLMLLGGAGVISVVSHIAGDMMKAMCESVVAGDIARARELHLRLLPLVRACFLPTSVSPSPVKAAVRLAGLNVGGLRLPLVPVTDDERAQIRAAMEDAGLL